MHSARESSLGFNLKRFYKFFRLLFSNRMAALGLTMLVISVTAALIAPIAYPSNPQTTSSSGYFAQPHWVTYFSDGYYLSSNLAVGSDPAFASPSALQQWSYGYSQAQSPYLSISWSPLTPSSPPSGSLEISSSSSSGLNVTVFKTFHYPYHGPPSRFFLPPLNVEAQGASPSQPIQVALSLTRGSEKTFTFWSTNLTKNNAWAFPPYVLDSSGTQFEAAAGLRQSDRLSLPEIIFSQVTDFGNGPAGGRPVRPAFMGGADLPVRRTHLRVYRNRVRSSHRANCWLQGGSH